MEKAPVLVDRPAPGVALVTFNRPEAHNALDTGLQRILDAQLTALEADAAIRCLVFTGAGDAAFSAGYDIHELARLPPDEVTLALLQREAWTWHLASLRLAEEIAANPPEGIGEAKRLLHAGPGRGLRDRYEAENVVMRTTLRPEPMPELFARFLAAHAEENGCPAATE